jgi:hypothetical protein
MSASLEVFRAHSQSGSQHLAPVPTGISRAHVCSGCQAPSCGASSDYIVLHFDNGRLVVPRCVRVAPTQCGPNGAYVHHWFNWLVRIAARPTVGNLQMAATKVDGFVDCLLEFAFGTLTKDEAEDLFPRQLLRGREPSLVYAAFLYLLLHDLPDGALLQQRLEAVARDEAEMAKGSRLLVYLGLWGTPQEAGPATEAAAQMTLLDRLRGVVVACMALFGRTWRSSGVDRVFEGQVRSQQEPGAVRQLLAWVTNHRRAALAIGVGAVVGIGMWYYLAPVKYLSTIIKVGSSARTTLADLQQGLKLADASGFVYLDQLSRWGITRSEATVLVSAVAGLGTYSLLATGPSIARAVRWGLRKFDLLTQEAPSSSSKPAEDDTGASQPARADGMDMDRLEHYRAQFADCHRAWLRSDEVYSTYTLVSPHATRLQTHPATVEPAASHPTVVLPDGRTVQTFQVRLARVPRALLGTPHWHVDAPSASPLYEDGLDVVFRVAASLPAGCHLPGFVSVQPLPDGERNANWTRHWRITFGHQGKHVVSNLRLQMADQDRRLQQEHIAHAILQLAEFVYPEQFPATSAAGAGLASETFAAEHGTRPVAFDYDVGVGGEKKEKVHMDVVMVDATDEPPAPDPVADAAMDESDASAPPQRPSATKRKAPNVPTPENRNAVVNASNAPSRPKRSKPAAAKVAGTRRASARTQ